MGCRLQEVCSGWGVLAVLLLFARSAEAQTSCITGPASVPGLSGAPNWFGSPASSSNPGGSRPDIDDPRWAGAPLLPFLGANSASAPTFRILRHGNYLYLSYHAPLSASGSDRVYFGFSEGVGAADSLTQKAYLLEIQPAPAGSGPDPIPTPVLQIQKFTPGVGWSPSATPNWIQNASTWRSPPGLAFGMNFRIAFKTSGQTDANAVFIPASRVFRAFVGVGIALEPAHTIEYSMPPVSPLSTTFINTGIHVPADYLQWAPMDGITNGCRDGITLDPQNIRTGHPDGSSLYTGGTNSQNTFIVRPQNIFGVSPQWGDHIVRVQLSLSDWGAVPLNSQAPWKPIAGSEGGRMTSGTWTWSWDTPGGPPPNSLGGATIGFTCAKQGSDAFCPRLTLPPGMPPSSVTSQAILASLSPKVGAPQVGRLRFTRPSAVLNTAFVGLSEAVRDAKISTEGLPSKPGQTHHTVYLMVVRRNMPAASTKTMTLALSAMERIRNFVQNPPPSSFTFSDSEVASIAPGSAGSRHAADEIFRSDGGPPSPQSVVGPGPAVLASPVPLEYSSATHHELLSRVWPIYEVHAFYETGDAVQEDGKSRKILQPLLPFGYLLHHQGPFYGFSDRLEALDGAELTVVEPDLYRASIPVDGSIRIRSTLRAEEDPPRILESRGPSRGCSLVATRSNRTAWTLLAIVPIYLLRRKRRETRQLDKIPTLS
jgi:hypothetical protein